MAKIQPVLIPAEIARVDRMAELTQSKRSDTAEPAILEGQGNRLNSEELGILAKDLAAALDRAEAAHIRKRLTRGFYGR
jgi:hypothetical protein